MNAFEWHILGPGSLGCLWATRLLEAGHRVQLIGRPGSQARDAVLSLEEAGQQRTFEARMGDAGSTGPIQRLLVATKAHQTLEALSTCLPYLTQDAMVLLLQNGMGVQQAAGKLLEPHPVFCGVSTEGAFLRGPLQVVHAGRGLTRIGALAPEHQPGLPVLLEALAGTRLMLEPEEDIQRRLWEKLAINCAINPLTALHRCRNGELETREDTRLLVRQACEEIGQVLVAEGYGELATALLTRTQEVIQRTAQNYSSMYQDVVAGRASEIDYITGYLLEAARRHGIDTPVNDTLHARIKALEP